MKKSILIGSCIIVILLTGCGSGTPDDITANTSTKPASSIVATLASTTSTTSFIEISAVDLYSAYEANEVAADLNYKDKTLRVTGII